MLLINPEKAVRIHFFVPDHGNGLPEGLIQIARKGIHKGVIFLTEHLIPPLFRDFFLIAVRFLPVKGADALDDLISF